MFEHYINIGKTFKSKCIKGIHESLFSEDSSLSNDENKKCDYREFIEDFNSRIWFTYRKGFRSLPGLILNQ